MSAVKLPPQPKTLKEALNGEYEVDQLNGRNVLKGAKDNLKEI
jgi:hypothetical protein